MVVKIGTSSLTDERGAIDRTSVAKLAAEIAGLRTAGHEVVLVSSGAIAAGVAALEMATRPTDITTLQAVSAVGQPLMLANYADELSTHGLVAAQALLDPHDFVDRRQYLHARRAINRLLELGCIPIVNENDAIASDEIRYGDNDRIAALVAHSVTADLLVLLTDLDGLYTADPRLDPAASLVARVAADDPLLAIEAGRSANERGSGGMAGKLQAARIASWSGVRTVIARASRVDVLADAVTDVGVGTTFAANERRMAARKLWIAFAAHVAGTIVVDAGAQRALVDGLKSLLPAGVVDVDGYFVSGDTVRVVGPEGSTFARGMVSIGAGDLRRAAGHHTSDLPDGVNHEAVHRDDLVLLPR